MNGNNITDDINSIANSIIFNDFSNTKMRIVNKFIEIIIIQVVTKNYEKILE